MTVDPAGHLGAPELPGAPHDLEFFLDPICPFAWQTSVWIRRVAELRNLSVGWRFISLHVLHEDDPDAPQAAIDARYRGFQFHRVLDAVRQSHGNDAVGRLFAAWGNEFWYREPGMTMVDIALSIDIAALLASEGLPVSLAAAADDNSHDTVIRAETSLAFERAGRDVGTPVITYGVGGQSFFGPVISSVPSDADSLALFDAINTLTKFTDFSELKRTKRPRIDLPTLRKR